MGRRLALLGLAALLLYQGALALFGGELESALRAGAEAGRMKNVITEEARLPVSRPLPEAAPAGVPAETAAPGSAPAALELRAPAAEGELPPRPMDGAGREEIRETTIRGGLGVRNETHYTLDASRILREGPDLRLPAEQPQILIIHTHGSEAYTPAGVDRYEANDQGRTADTEFNIVRVGDELAERLSAAGLRVLHDREIYDYPSYTGAYTRSGEAVERYLREYPGLAVVLDVHRDALGAEDVVYKTMAEEEGVVASQIMILVGTDESGLEHPNWRTNLSLALYLQESVGRLHPTLMRPVSVVPQRYNQQLTGGSLILEVGSSGNTLREALAAVRLFADAAGPALLALVDGGAAEETGA